MVSYTGNTNRYESEPTVQIAKIAADLTGKVVIVGGTIWVVKSVIGFVKWIINQ